MSCARSPTRSGRRSRAARGAGWSSRRRAASGSWRRARARSASAAASRASVPRCQIRCGALVATLLGVRATRSGSRPAPVRRSAARPVPSVSVPGGPARRWGYVDPLALIGAQRPQLGPPPLPARRRGREAPRAAAPHLAARPAPAPPVDRVGRDRRCSVACSGRGPFYVTTPIYYVNAAPHLGHAYTVIACDVLARHHRQRGEDVFFLTGTDEHGEPVALAAEAQGISPQRARRPQRRALQGADAAAGGVQRLLHPHERRGAQAPRPGGAAAGPRQRPHAPGHLRGLVLPALRGLQDRDRDRAGQHAARSTRSRSSGSRRRTGSSTSPRSRSASSSCTPSRPDFVQPGTRRNEALSFIKSGLQDVSLSRGKITWGVPVPWDPGHVFYVWFDALLNYYTALGYARPGEDLTDRFWPATYHVIGKDILKFHTVFWPALLMAAELRAARARLRPRLPARRRRAQDVQVAGQRAGPVRGDGRLRRRRAALLPQPRRAVRRRRLGVDGVARRALRGRARQRARQPRQPLDRDAAPLPRRPRARRRPGPAGRVRRARPRTSRGGSTAPT